MLIAGLQTGYNIETLTLKARWALALNIIDQFNNGIQSIVYYVNSEKVKYGT